MIKNITSYITLTWTVTRLAVASAMEYRFSFVLQVAGMVVNDIGLVVVWFIFFNRFPSIQGWTLEDSALLFAVGTVNVALMSLFLGGAREMASVISSGELDRHLSLPKGALWNIATSRTEIAAIGDIIFGFSLLFLFTGPVSLEKVLLYCAVCVITALIYFNFIVITQTVCFFSGMFEDAADQMFWALLGFSLYPQNVYSGVLKLITFTVIPAFFVAAVPVSVVKHFSWGDAGLLLGFLVLSTIIMVAFFRAGLRRYESGNLMTVRR